MRRNKSRYHKRSSSSSGGAMLFLMVVLVAAVIWFALTGWTGSWLARKLTGATAAPTATAGATAAPTVSPGATTPGEVPTDRVTETVHNEGFALYGVQLGAFAQKENAQALLTTLTDQHLAGCLLGDGERTRVLGALAATREEAVLARDALTTRYDMDAIVYEIVVPGVDLKVVADAAQLEAMTDSFAAWREAVQALVPMTVDFEAGRLSAEEAQTQLGTLAEKLGDAAGLLRSTAGDVSGSAVLTQWLAVMDDAEGDLRALSQDAVTASDRDAKLSAKLKQALVDTVAGYNTFVAGNPSGRPF